jgi:hypothetical protein
MKTRATDNTLLKGVKDFLRINFQTPSQNKVIIRYCRYAQDDVK